ncbi:MAG: UDP-galactopyranose mutase [Erysipelotrichaceae bacterium]|nr:UDP-galactopyranose mutase [Erysipelotrichaceae bacterium]
MRYDYLIVGSGFFGSVFAYQAKKKGHSVIVVEKRDHIGGNVYTENIEGIDVHRYGAHIFHTNNQKVWNFINRFAKFNDYKHHVIADYKGERYDLPFNMNTFHQMWGINSPETAMKIIDEQRKGIIDPLNLEEQCISMVGTDIYQKLVKGYTEKQWGRDCKDLPSFVIRRLPVRFEYNSNYFNDTYQGIPEGGYTQIIEKLLKGIEVRLNYDFLKHRDEIEYDKLVFTGPIDAYYDYRLGRLEYRSLRFETEVLDIPDYQGNSVINYTDREIPYTRIIEHKHFGCDNQPKTIISREYPLEWDPEKEPYYPINDERNDALYHRYLELAKDDPNVIFGGRLGEYKYYDMDKVIERALSYW